MRFAPVVVGFVSFTLMLGAGQALLAQTSTPGVSGSVTISSGSMGAGFAVDEGDSCR
jgi:hypothetical protein